MKKSFQNFIVRLFIFSAAISLLAFIVKLIFPGDYFTPALPYLIIFFFAFTGLVHYILLKAGGMEARKFLNYFMIATFLKFFVYIVVIFGYIFVNKDDILRFVIAFFALYILYTAFEVVAIVKQQK